MRNSLRLVLGLSSASIFGAMFLIACSDDTDLQVTPEAGVDSPTGTETGVPEAGTDTAPPFDGGFVLDTFDRDLATEICRSLARCCFGTPMPAPDGGADGGTFDQAKCVADLGLFGFQGSNVPAAVKDAGNVELDQLKADDCITKVKALKCDLPGPDYTAVRAACFGAYVGKLAAGQPCKGVAECQAGNFCKAPAEVDGGVGVCSALRPLDGPCGDNPTSLTERDEACSYRAGGGSNNYCKLYEPATAAYLDAGDWKCAAAGGAGTECFTSTWCKDTICAESTFTCKTPEKIFDTACGAYVK